MLKVVLDILKIRKDYSSNLLILFLNHAYIRFGLEALKVVLKDLEEDLGKVLITGNLTWEFFNI